MNFFEIKTSWTNAELIPLKLCIGSVDLVIGSYFNEIVSNYYIPLLIVFVITVVWTMYLWLLKMKKNKQ